jgi:hypothetical protein
VTINVVTKYFIRKGNSELVINGERERVVEGIYACQQEYNFFFEFFRLIVVQNKSNTKMVFSLNLSLYAKVRYLG